MVMSFGKALLAGVALAVASIGAAAAQYIVLDPSEAQQSGSTRLPGRLATDEEINSALGSVYSASKTLLYNLDTEDRRNLLRAYHQLVRELAAFDSVDLKLAGLQACGPKPSLGNADDFVCLANLTYIGVAVAADAKSDGLYRVPEIRLNATTPDGLVFAEPIRMRLDKVAVARAVNFEAEGRKAPPFPFVLLATHSGDKNWRFEVTNVLDIGGNLPSDDTLTAKIAERREREEAERQAALEAELLDLAVVRQRALASRYPKRVRRSADVRAWVDAFNEIRDGAGQFIDGTDNPCGAVAYPPTEADRRCISERTFWLFDDPQGGLTFPDRYTYLIQGDIDGEAVETYGNVGKLVGKLRGVTEDDPQSVVFAFFEDRQLTFAGETVFTLDFDLAIETQTIAPDQIVAGLGNLYDELAGAYGINLALREGQRTNFIVGRDILYCRQETGDLLLVPSGFVTDLASVSNWLRAIMMINESPREFPGAILHDWLYAISRPENEDDHQYSDMLFREELDDAEAGWLTRRMFPLGTRIGGRSAVGRPAEVRFATEESCRRGHGFRGVPQNAIVGRYGEGLPAGNKCEGFLDDYETLLAELGQSTPFDTSIIVNEEPRARYFEDVVANEDPNVACPFTELED